MARVQGHTSGLGGYDLNTKHGVLIEGALDHPNLCALEGKALSHSPVKASSTLTELASVAATRQLTHLWVSANPDSYRPEASHDEWSIKPFFTRRGDHLKTVSLIRRGSENAPRYHVNIIFPKYTAWWGNDKHPGWIQGASPIEIIGTVTYLERALGIPVAGSPGGIGWDLLKKLRPEWIEDIPVNLAKIHFTPRAACDLIWQHPRLAALVGKFKFIHKFDRAAAYPYAGSRAFIGVGTPEYKDHGRDMDPVPTSKGTYSPSKAVGVWRCSINRHEEPADLPPAWDEGDGWLVGPIINLVRAAGHKVTVHEGYVFPDKHQLLAPWSNFLWNVREQFEGKPGRCYALARKAIKQIANATIGLTAYRGFNESEQEMRRPDIRLQAVAGNREMMWHNIMEVYRLQQEAPAIVYMDAIYYLSNAEDGRAGFPILMKREGQQGGYKYEGRVSLTQEVRKKLLSEKGENDMLAVLNDEGWVL